MTGSNLLYLCVTLITMINRVLNASLASLGITNALYDIPGLGNQPTRVRVIPGKENFQSPIYEVYGVPYGFGVDWQNGTMENLGTAGYADRYNRDIQRCNMNLDGEQAVANLQSIGESGVTGEIMFIQDFPPTGPTIILGNVTGLTTGRHGLHIHQSGDTRDDCTKIGDHFNPYLSQHGGPEDPIRHVGDLGNIEAGENGVAEINFIDPLVSLSSGPRGAVGRCLVVTADPDDYGRGGSADSLNSGKSGNPVACGVIAYVR